MIGARIGQYRVLQLLGEGGMGRVLLAEHVVMKTRHAIKVLHDQLSSNEMIVQRFLNEARAAGAIGHRNVVEVTHVDQIEGGGPWYLVMKYLEGRTLARFLESHGAPIEQRLIVHIVGEALNGLQAAHGHRITHRDLKPDNLYLTAVKNDPYRTIILDFGVAQLGHEAGVITRTGTLIGTPQYMAPEQHRSGPVDHRTDIWAMGAIVYEMATGRLPYQRDASERGFLSGPVIFHRMMSHAIVDPRQYNPSLTEGFAKATLTALALDPARRPDRAGALAMMLADATPGNSQAPSGIEVLKLHADELLGVEAGPSPAPQGAGPPPRIAAQIAVPAGPMSTLGATVGQSFPGVQRTPARRSRRPWLAAGLGVVAATVSGMVLLSRHGALAPARLQDPISAAPADTAFARESAHDQPRSAPGAARDTAHADAIIAAGAAREPPHADASIAAGAARETAHVDAGSAAVAAQEPPHAGVAAGTTREAAHTDASIAAGAAREPARGDAIAEDAARNAVRGGTTIDPVTKRPASSSGIAEPVHPEVVAHSGARTSAPDASPAGTAPLAVTARDAASPEGPAHTASAPAARADPAATGSLKVVVLPWAEVWVDGRPLGQTPVVTKVSAGAHRVRLKNDATEKTVNVTVTNGKTTLIDQAW
jgi:serine/threonine-protein kinase